jgi:hypothetical protein
MSEEIEKEFPPVFDKNTYLAEIERLFLEGLSSRQIAVKLGESSGLTVGRNLREIKKRWARAAARQQALAPTRCATVYQEAMEGWERSQKSKHTSTEHLNKEKEVDKTINRTQEGPGDKTFLQAAVAALKALRQFAPFKDVATPAKTRELTDREYLVMFNCLTQEQMESMPDEQIRRIRTAIENVQAELDAHRRDEERSQDEAACLHAGDQAELSRELAPQGAGEVARPGGDGRLPPADGIHAPATRQERAGEPPLPGVHAGPQPGPAADRGQPHP